jgi:hypothetical protein
MVDNFSMDEGDNQDTTVDNLDDDSRPGGPDGQDVRARKEYDRRKEAEADRDRLAREAELLEQRIQALEAEKNNNQQPIPANMTEAQIHEAYSAGRMDAATAERELERARINERDTFKKEILDTVKQSMTAEQLVREANEEIEEFVKIYPDLKDKDSKLFGQVRSEYRRLRSLNSPDNPLTEHLAVRTVLGSLDRAKSDMARSVDDYDRENRGTIVEPPAGSSRPSDNLPGTQDADLRKVSKIQRQYWDEQGYSMERQRELAKYWQPSRLNR